VFRIPDGFKVAAVWESFGAAYSECVETLIFPWLFFYDAKVFGAGLFCKDSLAGFGHPKLVGQLGRSS